MKLFHEFRFVFLGGGIGCVFDTLAAHFSGAGHELRFAIPAAVFSVLYVLGVLAK